jgi:hypothetical protein
MTGADPEIRHAVLRYASALAADPSDAVTVVVNAIPLLGWLQDAPDEQDQALRKACMDRHHANVHFLEGGAGELLTPEEFLAGVITLYAFVTTAFSGDTAPEAA